MIVTDEQLAAWKKGADAQPEHPTMQAIGLLLGEIARLKEKGVEMLRAMSDAHACIDRCIQTHYPMAMVMPCFGACRASGCHERCALSSDIHGVHACERHRP
jgi:hypothetical protein